jgi:colicin import membrane protein
MTYRNQRSFVPFIPAVIRLFICYATSDMIDNSGICAFPGCTRPTAPPPVTGGRSRYCDDPGHNPTTAYRARRRPPAEPAPVPDDPAAARARIAHDLARLERTLADVRETLGPPAPPPRLDELERELAAATAATAAAEKARAAAEAALERALEEARAATGRAEQAQRVGVTDRQWLAEAAAHIKRTEGERDAALTRAAEAEARAERAEVARQTAEDRAYAAESAWRTLDWQLADQIARADKAEAALRELRGQDQAPLEG